MGAVQRVRDFSPPPIRLHRGGRPVGRQGVWRGKKLLRGGQPLGQGLAQFVLVGFNRQQEVTPGLLHDLTGGARGCAGRRRQSNNRSH